ncbi:hypothetical protein OH460_08315 [Vibrio sp. Makdt]|uniref:hypothetical protein n=1 Tax=Vibrio sp. Makdt TaxID=2998828 RepID=UPI0022CDB24A|nr:hypothetical protein [Vibrio sp. Makdt]MDA0152303.1 hypothetical protein [Vibrio sp. Makdt]
MNDLMNLIKQAATQTPEAFLASLEKESAEQSSKPRHLSEGMQDFIKITVRKIAEENDDAGVPDWRIREQFAAKMRMRARRLFNATYGRNELRDPEVRSYIREIVASV